jgi:hypothetical protein
MNKEKIDSYYNNIVRKYGVSGENKRIEYENKKRISNTIYKVSYNTTTFVGAYWIGLLIGKLLCTALAIWFIANIIGC